MPSPKLRTLGRRALTQAQRIEATLGPAADRPSLFSSTAEAADARERVRAEAGDRGEMDTLMLGSSLLRELDARHLRHTGSIRDSRTCLDCNPYGWQPEWMTGEWGRREAERSEAMLAAQIHRDAAMGRLFNVGKPTEAALDRVAADYAEALARIGSTQHLGGSQP